MEALTKSHVLSDGNKRCAMMVAELMIKVNDCELILPLKSIRLSVDTAMDKDDAMTEEIEQWFKVHTAKNSDQLSIMLREHLEEESIINSLLEQNKDENAEELLGNWMSFDNYPEYKAKWEKLVKQWKKRNMSQNTDKIHTTIIWNILGSISQYEVGHPDHNSIKITRIEDLSVINHTLKELKKYEKKIRIHEKQLTNPNHLDLLYNKGFILSQFGRSDKLLEVYNRIIGIKPDEAHAYYHRGTIYGKFFNDHKKALKDFQKCVKMGEQTQEIHHNIVYSLFMLGKYDEAIKHCDECIPNSAKVSEFYRIKGMCMYEKNSLDEAEKAIRTAIKLDSSNSSYMASLGDVLLEKRNYKKAIKCYEYAVSKNPEFISFRYALAHAYSATGQNDKAEQSYCFILETDENNIETLINYGALLSNRGEYNKALKLLDKALDINPIHEIALINAGITCSKIGKYEKAMNHFQRAVNLYPKNRDASYGKAVVFMQQNKIDDSLIWIENTIRIDPNIKKEFLTDATFERIKNSIRFKKITSTLTF